MAVTQKYVYRLVCERCLADTMAYGRAVGDGADLGLEDVDDWFIANGITICPNCPAPYACPNCTSTNTEPTGITYFCMPPKDEQVCNDCTNKWGELC